MTRTRIQALGAAVLALSMGVGSVAMAQPRGHDNRGPAASHHRDAPRWDNNRGPGWDRHGPPPRVVDHRGRGAGPNRDLYRGGRLPSYYRTPHYVVNDWRSHRLSAPPRGYHWVQTGGDYVLAAIATGVILQVLLNN